MDGLANPPESRHGRNKAAILEQLSISGLTFRVEPFLVFSVAEWFDVPDAIRRRVHDANLGPTVIVRSAWRSEDVGRESAPGEFVSVSDVPAHDWSAVGRAIDRVIASYRKAGPLLPEHDHVIVQRQLVDVRLAGVARPSEDGLYLQVDYDDLSGRTDTVTAGWSSRSVALLTGAELPQPWATVAECNRDIQRVLSSSCMFEFAINRSGMLSVFQAKQIRVKNGKNADADPRQMLERTLRALPSDTVLSDMADWNPAEMLGARPRPFATSLYRTLVTDQAWLKARTSLGYRSVEPSNLIIEIAEKPYVDVRRSCLSLIPAEINTEFASRLADDRLAVLRDNGHLHDRVETALFFTCGDVAEYPRTRTLLARGFQISEVFALERELNWFTSTLVNRESVIRREDQLSIQHLTRWFRKNRPDGRELQLRCAFVYAALAACRDYGVVPFARQARLAFIGQDLFGRLVELNIIPRGWSEIWWRGLNSVASRVTGALADLSLGRVDRTSFNEQYGHLRARAYDIRCLPYSALEFPATLTGPKEDIPEPNFADLDLQGISKALRRSGICIEATEFFGFVRMATLGREEGKFAFTRFLSFVLEEVAEMGDELGFSRDDLSFLSVSDLSVDHQADGRAITQAWRGSIERRKQLWCACSMLRLPDLIKSSADLLCVQDVHARPNFITDKVVIAEGIVLDPTEPVSPSLVRGRIVVTEAAEPGMDWIFAYGISGLITRYGGRNSHMATRCAEFGIPAAIGCGSAIINRIATGGTICLDCRAERVEPLPKT